MGFRPFSGDRNSRSDGGGRLDLRPSVSQPDSHANARAGSNPVVDWLRSTGRPFGEYLKRLAKLDHGMVESLKNIYGFKAVGHRLSLTLFVDYSQTQGLAPGEAAVLLGDVENVCADAMDFLVKAAMLERCTPKPSTAFRGSLPGEG
jgi:hypothetical protein